MRADELLHEISEGGNDDDGAEETIDVAVLTLVTRLVSERDAVATLLLDDAEAAEGEADIIAQAVLSSAEIGLSHEPMSESITAILRHDAGAALADRSLTIFR